MIGVLADEGVRLAGMPDDAAIGRAVRAALDASGCIHGADGGDAPELCIRLASDAAVRELNARWRGKDRVTDVLSFPMQDAPVDAAAPLGDVVLAVDFVRAEAARLGLEPEAHALHLIVHGVLHLLGFDHMEAGEEARMRAIENDAMQALGLHRPWPATA